MEMSCLLTHVVNCCIKNEDALMSILAIYWFMDSINELPTKAELKCCLHHPRVQEP